MMNITPKQLLRPPATLPDEEMSSGGTPPKGTPGRDMSGPTQTRPPPIPTTLKSPVAQHGHINTTTFHLPNEEILFSGTTLTTIHARDIDVFHGRTYLAPATTKLRRIYNFEINQVFGRRRNAILQYAQENIIGSNRLPSIPLPLEAEELCGELLDELDLTLVGVPYTSDLLEQIGYHLDPIKFDNLTHMLKRFVKRAQDRLDNVVNLPIWGVDNYPLDVWSSNDFEVLAVLYRDQVETFLAYLFQNGALIPPNQPSCSFNRKKTIESEGIVPKLVQTGERDIFVPDSKVDAITNQYSVLRESNIGYGDLGLTQKRKMQTPLYEPRNHSSHAPDGQAPSRLPELHRQNELLQGSRFDTQGSTPHASEKTADGDLPGRGDGDLTDNGGFSTLEQLFKLPSYTQHPAGSLVPSNRDRKRDLDRGDSRNDGGGSGPDPGGYGGSQSRKPRIYDPAPISSEVPLEIEFRPDQIELQDKTHQQACKLEEAPILTAVCPIAGLEYRPFEPVTLKSAAKVYTIIDQAALICTESNRDINGRLLTWNNIFATYPELKTELRTGSVHSDMDPFSQLRRRVLEEQEPMPEPSGLRIEILQLASTFVKHESIHSTERTLLMVILGNPYLGSLPVCYGIAERYSILIGADHKKIQRITEENSVRDVASSPVTARALTLDISEELEDNRQCMQRAYPRFNPGDEGPLFFEPETDGNRLCVPKALRREIVKTAHDELEPGAHGGYLRTYQCIASRFYWRGMSKTS